MKPGSLHRGQLWIQHFIDRVPSQIIGCTLESAVESAVESLHQAAAAKLPGGGEATAVGELRIAIAARKIVLSKMLLRKAFTWKVQVPKCWLSVGR